MRIVRKKLQELFNSELPKRSFDSSIPVNNLEVLACLEHISMQQAVSKMAAPGCVDRICAKRLYQWLGRHLPKVEPWSHHVAVQLQKNESHTNQQARFFWPWHQTLEALLDCNIPSASAS